MREYRTSYSVPCGADRLRKPGHIARRVHVGVPPCSARTGKTMFLPFSYFPANRASLARIGGVDENHVNPSRRGLVGKKVLKRSECPAMPPRSNPLSSLDVGSDVSQVFHANFAGMDADGLRDHGLAGFVVHVFHMQALAPGDSA